MKWVAQIPQPPAAAFNPSQTKRAPSSCRLRPVKQADRNSTREKAYYHCERYNAPIMLDCQAGESFVHGEPVRRNVRLFSTGPYVVRLMARR